MASANKPIFFTPLLYSDVRKKATDLINKDFHDKQKLEIKLKPDSSVSNEITLTGNKSGDGYLATVFPKYTFTSSGRVVTLGGTIDVAESTGKAELTVENIVPGAKVVTTADSRKKSVQVDLEYRHSSATVKASLEGSQTDQISGSFAPVVGYNGFSVGAETRFHQAKGVTGIDGVAAYATDSYVFSLFGSFYGARRVGFSHFHRVNDKIQLGVEASGDVDSKDKSKSSFVVGGSYQLDNDTSLKAKVDTTGKLSLASTTRLNRNLRLELGTSIDLVNNNRPLGYGFTLAFND